MAEVFGIIAGLPSAIQIIKTTIATAKQFIRKQDLLDEIDELQKQLDAVQKPLEYLCDLRKREPAIFDESSLQNIKSRIAKLQKHLQGLSAVLDHHVSTSRKQSIVRQLKLAIKGSDQTIKKHRDGIEEVKSSLSLIIESVHLKYTTQPRRLLESNLSPCESDFIPRKLDGTCEWIWNQPEFKQWIEYTPVDGHASVRRLFCLHGPTGSGKSVLSASVAAKLREGSKVVAFFSFRAPYSKHQAFRSLLETVLSQILPHISDKDLNNLPHHVTRSSSLPEQSLMVALHFVLSLVKSRAYLIIDGVDEATDIWDDSKISGLQTMIEILEKHTNVHIWLSGRESGLRAAIRKHPQELQLCEELIKEDMNAFIEEHLSRSTCIKVSLMRDFIRQSLRSNSQMMFLWVILFFKGLKQDATESEIKDSLQTRLGDLNDKYRSLLIQTINHTGGTSADPSISMKRAKRLLSLIIAASRTLTLAELDCAYAAECGGTQSDGYSKLTRDGLIDDCAGFVIEMAIQVGCKKESRFQVIHASAVEFLTRPVNRWDGVDREVAYFAIDQTFAQRDIFQACAEYLSSLDWGYPMYDKNEDDKSLSAKYPFLAYASDFMPGHLLSIMATSFDSKLRTSLQSFVSSTQFCGLIEYLMHNAESGSLDMATHWMDSLLALMDYKMCPDSAAQEFPALSPEDYYSDIIASFGRELNRREALFGENDKRFQIWAAITGFTAHTLVSNKNDLNESPKTEFGESSIIVPMPNLASATERALSKLPVFLSKTAHQGAVRACVQSGISTLRSKFQPLRSWLVIPNNMLPVPLQILWAQLYWDFSNQRDALVGKSMLLRALNRLGEKRDFYRSWCLVTLGRMEGCCDPKSHEVDSCLALSLFNESLVIAEGLKSCPPVELVILRALCSIAEHLLSHGQIDEGLKISQRLETLLCQDELTQKGSRWYKVVYKSKLGSSFTLSALSLLVKALRDAKCFNECERIIQFILDATTKRYHRDHPVVFHYIEVQAQTLRLAGKVEDAYAIMRSSLERLDKLEDTTAYRDIRWTHLWHIAKCLLISDSHAEMVALLSDVEISSVMDSFKNASALFKYLTVANCFDRAMELYRCWNVKHSTKKLCTLEFAASYGFNEAVKVMLDAGVSVESCDQEDGRTSLSCAAEFGNTPLVRLLLERGANIHHVDLEGHTPIDRASLNGHHSCVELLQDHEESLKRETEICKGANGASAHGAMSSTGLLFGPYQRLGLMPNTHLI